ncbi:MAG: M23 family metallopeptidase [Bacillota bacterium]|nr:M23 family metallopeptidase [Bacillota bacterium]
MLNKRGLIGNTAFILATIFSFSAAVVNDKRENVTNLRENIVFSTQSVGIYQSNTVNTDKIVFNSEENGVPDEQDIKDNLIENQKTLPRVVGKPVAAVSTENNKAADANNSSVKKTSATKTSSNRAFRMPVSGSITSKFGMRWGRMHEGIDIGASTGTDVYAAMDGEVTYSGWESGYGNLVIISHGNGFETYYGHNSKLLVKVGQTVKKGTHISEVGSTGDATGPHCHFEIRKNGTPVNPFNYIN